MDDIVGAMFRNFFQDQEICEISIERRPWLLQHVPNQYKTQEMCKKAVEN